jgi:multisubunit Na+/H+ antiporter MnhB subunit
MVRRILGLVLVVLVSSAVLVTIAELPPYASEGNPAENYVYQRYVEDAVEDIGVTNMVAAIVIDYRGYDTLIETTVLFTSVIAVLITSKFSFDSRKDEQC